MNSQPSTSPGGAVRVFVIDDHQPFREALRRFLDGEAWIEIVGEANAHGHIATAAAAAQPDVVLFDPGLHKFLLRGAISQLRERVPGVCIIVVALDEGTDIRERAARAGANAFVAKERVVDELLAAIRRVARRT